MGNEPGTRKSSFFDRELDPQVVALFAVVERRVRASRDQTSSGLYCRNRFVGGSRRGLRVLVAAIVTVVLIMCVNLGNLIGA